MNILKNYCKNQSIELRNMEEVANEIDIALDNIIPNIVHEIGDLIEEDE